MTTAHFSDGSMLVTKGSLDLMEVERVYREKVFGTSQLESKVKIKLSPKERVDLLNAKSKYKQSKLLPEFTDNRIELMGLIANSITPDWNVKFNPLK